MKNYYFITLFFLSAISHAQIVNIPDANFKYTLVNKNCVDTDGDGVGDSNADTNNDGEIQVSEAEAVIRLIVHYSNIFSLEGIQSFTNLEDLRCGNNPLTSLDLTQNLKLEYLSTYSNHQLSSLDVTQNSNLKVLICTENQLSSLDVSQNLNLERLDCGWNQLTNLDVSQNLFLEWLACYQNQLTSLDISQNLNIKWLTCAYNPLTILDVTQNPNLEVLICSYNQLTDLDLSQNPNLDLLDCDRNQLTSLNLTQNTNLERLRCYDNQLTYLNIKNGNNHNMDRMHSYGNPNLICITVDDNNAFHPHCDLSPTLPLGWCKDSTAIYNEDCELGIEDNNSITFTMFPNPTQNILIIESQVPIELIRIYSVSGSLIKETSKTSISVSELPSGLYFAQINIGGHTVNKKFVKL